MGIRCRVGRCVSQKSRQKEKKQNHQIRCQITGLNVTKRHFALKLWHEDGYHNVHLVSIVHICVCHNVVVALGVDVQLIVVVVVVVEVVVDVGDDGEDVERGGEKCHLSNAHSGCICCCGTPEHKKT